MCIMWVYVLLHGQYDTFWVILSDLITFLSCEHACLRDFEMTEMFMSLFYCSFHGICWLKRQRERNKTSKDIKIHGHYFIGPRQLQPTSKIHVLFCMQVRKCQVSWKKNILKALQKSFLQSSCLCSHHCVNVICQTAPVCHLGSLK